MTEINPECFHFLKKMQEERGGAIIEGKNNYGTVCHWTKDSKDPNYILFHICHRDNNDIIACEHYYYLPYTEEWEEDEDDSDDSDGGSERFRYADGNVEYTL